MNGLCSGGGGLNSLPINEWQNDCRLVKAEVDSTQTLVVTFDTVHYRQKHR